MDIYILLSKVFYALLLKIMAFAEDSNQRIQCEVQEIPGFEPRWMQLQTKNYAIMGFERVSQPIGWPALPLYKWCSEPWPLMY